MGMNKFFHENRLAFSIMGIILGLPLTIISILSLFHTDGADGMTLWANGLVGVWAYWLVLPALVFIIIGSYYTYDFIRNFREFKELMKVPSKAKFIKNQDRIEELAWKLHPRYEMQVVERKRKLKIR